MGWRHRNDGSDPEPSRWTAFVLGAGSRVSPESIQLLAGCLRAQVPTLMSESGGDEETRTPDPLLAKEMLCQLSYVPSRPVGGGRFWTRTRDLCLIRAVL